MTPFLRTTLGLFFLGFLAGCGKSDAPSDPLFEALPASQTGVDFVNEVRDDKQLNIFNYRNFYNGGGVAIGDVNNDGLPDVFLTSNMGSNKLYLNRGDFKFEDVSEQAGIQGKHAWSTGVTFADVNGDGWLDIYVCNAGNRTEDDRANELFISNGVKSPLQGSKGGVGDIPTFSEKAKDLGLADRGSSTHAAFFDYDRDGDLDMYLLNNSFIPIGRLGYRNLRTERDYEGGDKLFRNDGGKFTDASDQAGIYGSVIGFGLGITIGDVNDDNWPDIYISNDFYERDYLYLNNRDGTFRESLEQAMNHISLSSMGADIADLNNDGRLDIFVTDMLPGDDRRLKTTSTYEGYDLTDFKLKQGYHHQVMRNNLHLNLGEGVGQGREGGQGSSKSPSSLSSPSIPVFSEVGQLTGTSSTDWSWGALLFDMDNDGRKDIFVANGIQKNLTDQDFIAFFGDQRTVQKVVANNFDYEEFLKEIPTQPIPNYAFRNEGNLKFTNVAKAWGLGEPSLSNGAAYGDLDGDGDLDLVVSNVNEPVSFFKNRTNEKLKNHFLRVRLAGTPLNRQGIGAKVTVYRKSAEPLLLQQMPNRGFQSSSDHVMVFGLGEIAAIDSVKILWPDDRMQTLAGVKADTELTLNVAQADRKFTPANPHPSNLQTFKPRGGPPSSLLTHRHVENADFVDYNRDPLLKQMLSREGPALAVGDVNGDGLDDVYLGGASNQPKALFVQQKNGGFSEKIISTNGLELAQEDVAAHFFDADGDRDLDLYVVTGGNEFQTGSVELQDRFYRNDGKGGFTKDATLPNLTDNGACVTAGDFDRDGDLDLFVGSRMISGQYGLSPVSALLVNDGKGVFKVQTKRFLPTAELGMVTDARWVDLDGDQFPELVTAQDWGPITVYRNERGRKLTPAALPQSEGFWNRLHAADVDGDGDVDLIAGNLGLNNRLHARPETPAELAVNDFDRNGTTDQIISCVTENGKVYPMVLKPDLQKAIPGIKNKFLKHSDYAEKTLDELFDETAREGMVKRQAVQSASCVLFNDGKGNLTLKPLPLEAQLSPTFGIETLDYDADGKPDLVLTGNFFDVLPEIGRYDASFGTVLRGDGKGGFATVPNAQTGFFVRGQVRRMQKLTGPGGNTYLILAKNNDAVEVFAISPPPKKIQ